MSYKPPKGVVTEKVIRGLIRSIARELNKDTLSTREKLALLREQRQLAAQLRESAAAQDS